MLDAALVLEGGALRGMFTAGVLDELMEREIEFAYVNGVSAGSLNGINYISKQKGRSRDINLDYVNDPRYLGVRNIRMSWCRLTRAHFLRRGSALKWLRRTVRRGRQSISRRAGRRRLCGHPQPQAVCRSFPP